MAEQNLIADKSFQFGVKIVKLYQHLSKDTKYFPLFNQILRSGTSIGANVEEAVGGFSKKDFNFKLSTAYKETRETRYWLKLLNQTGYLSKEEFEPLNKECEELSKILYTILHKSQ